MKNLLIITLLVLVSCKPTKTIVKTETIHDTIYKEKIIKISVPVTSFVEVEKPCDSLGNLKPFKTVIKTKKIYVTVEGKDNVITAKINLDSIKQSTIKEFRSNFKETTHKEVITKYKVPKWAWWLLAANVLYIVYRLRKFIPYLKLLPI